MASYEFKAFVYGATLPRPVKVEWNGAIDTAGVKDLAVEKAKVDLISASRFDLLVGATADGEPLIDTDVVDVATATNEKGIVCFYAKPVAGACGGVCGGRRGSGVMCEWGRGDEGPTAGLRSRPRPAHARSVLSSTRATHPPLPSLARAPVLPRSGRRRDGHRDGRGRRGGCRQQRGG
jgi:hypothetical protein